jgi:hypothetical protein
MVAINYSFEALNFNGICKTIAISLCPLIGQYEGIEPVCYSRNVELGGNIIFQPCKYEQSPLYTASFLLTPYDFLFSHTHY